MLEEERKYEVQPDFAVPDLSGCLPSGGRVHAPPAVTLRAIYYDTPDRRLARAGLSLRHRRGDAEPWTVKLPTGTTGVRKEVSRPGGPRSLPSDLVGLLTAYHRGAPLEPAAQLRTVRRTYELRDASDEVLAEIADDTVQVLDGRQVRLTFREVEVERKGGTRKLLDRVDVRLRAAGGVPGDFIPKYVRAIGPEATAAPDLAPPDRPSRKARAGEVVTAAVRRAVARILTHDPWVRLDEPLPDGDTPVHQMRVGTRRLRSDLRTFRSLLDPEWTGHLRDELSWLADALGAARDAEVLRSRLRHTAGNDPLAPTDDAAIARLDADLAARHGEALRALDAVLRSDRYIALVDTLLVAAREPRLAAGARKPAAAVLPRLVARPWSRLVNGGTDLPGAGDLQATDPDDDWHAVRIRGKRARYAADAVAGVLGGGAGTLAKALADVQDVLGEHQDAAVAAQTWLSVAQADPDDHALAVTAGRLYERERTAVREARARFPAAWRAAIRSRNTDWLVH